MRRRFLLGLPAPAKVNLFLHVVGRRADGYHELQTAFAPIDLADELDFESLPDGRIERDGDLIGPLAQDLCVRAATALRAAAGCEAGIRIGVRKRIPAGSGLGGGSSDAATTLIAANRLWGLDWSRARLAAIGRTLGADVPFFLQPGAAFGEGIGERLSPVALPPFWLVLVDPAVHCSTVEAFSAPELTRDTKPVKISGFSAAVARICDVPFGSNDLEPVVRRRVVAVDAALKLVERHLGQPGHRSESPATAGYARMSGSGSAVFAPFAAEATATAAADRIRAEAPSDWSVRVVRSLAEHPLGEWLGATGGA